MAIWIQPPLLEGFPTLIFTSGSASHDDDTPAVSEESVESSGNSTLLPYQRILPGLEVLVDSSTQTPSAPEVVETL